MKCLEVIVAAGGFGVIVVMTETEDDGCVLYIRFQT